MTEMGENEINDTRERHYTFSDDITDVTERHLKDEKEGYPTETDKIRVSNKNEKSNKIQKRGRKRRFEKEDSVKPIVTDKNGEINTDKSANRKQVARRGRPRKKVSEKQTEKLVKKVTGKIMKKMHGFVGFVPRVKPKNTNIVNITSPPAKVKKYENRHREDNQSRDDDRGDEGDEEIDDVVFIDKDNKSSEEQKTANKKCIDCEQMYRDEKNNPNKKICRMCKSNEHGCIKDDQRGNCMEMIDEMRDNPEDFDSVY